MFEKCQNARPAEKDPPGGQPVHCYIVSIE